MGDDGVGPYCLEMLAKPVAQRLSPHDPSLEDALLTADFVGEGPREVVLVGVIPTKVEMGTELSPEVEAAVPAICSKVLESLVQWGVQPQERQGGTTDVWWSRFDA